MALRLTPSGTDLLLRAIAGEAEIDFKAIQLGNGADAGESAAALSNPLLTAEISSYEIGDIFVTLTSTFSNSEVPAGFRATELGVLAADPDNEGGTLLYAYQYTPEAESDYIPASADKVLETQMDVMVYIGDAANVTASISESLVYASKAELDDHIQDTSNPHKVTKEQIGLGNVSNVATNDQTPTYTTAGTLTALVSGEKLSAAFGKLARAVSSLISHLADKANPHGVTAAQVGAAAESHKHSAADITSGILGTARGGTGVSSYYSLRDKLGLGYGTGVLGVEYGGTGVNSYSALREALGVNCKVTGVSPTRIILQELTGSSGHWSGKEHQNYAAYGNGVFVVMGGTQENIFADVIPAAYVSADGVTFETVESGIPNEYFAGIAFGGGVFAAVFETQVLRSSDGRTWTSAALPEALPAARIVFGGGVFMLLAVEEDTAVCYTSEDAQTWTAHEMPALSSGAFYTGLCYGGGRFAAVTSTGAVTWSADRGASWSGPKDISGFGTARDIVYGHGKYVVWRLSSSGTDSQPRLAYSGDLESWELVQRVNDTGEIERLGVTAAGFCANVSPSNPNYGGLYYSEDLAAWNRCGVNGSEHYIVDTFLAARGRMWAYRGTYETLVSDSGDFWTARFFQVSDASGHVWGPLKEGL